MIKNLLPKKKQFKRTRILKPTLSFWLVVLLISQIIAGALFFVSPKEARADTAIFYSTNSDGGMYKKNPVYANAHDSENAQGVFTSGVSTSLGQIGADPGGYDIRRAYLYFDTSSLGALAAISSATLSLYGRGDDSSVDFEIVIQNGQPTYPHDPLESGDWYYANYSGNGGSFNTTGFSTTGYNDITLNASGISWINKVGITKFCLRSSHDIDNIPPGPNWEENERVRIYLSEGGSGYQPKLTIEYTAPPNQPPNISTLNSPSDGATGVTLTPELKFDYSDSDGGSCTKFDLQVDDDPGFSSPEINETDYSSGGPWLSGSTITYSVSSALSYSTQYYWKVRVYDGQDWSNWSDGSWDFTTINLCGTTAYNVSGYAWSENIGWISFSCRNCDIDGDGDSDGASGCPAAGTSISDYGVNISEATGEFSGYAWSENIGWISFSSGELLDCPSGTCKAEVNLETGEVSGWAKVLAASDGWDGWIRLRDTDYGVYIDGSSEFRDWAWSDMVVGWLSFNCKNRGVCTEATAEGGPSDYKVITTLEIIPSNNPPQAVIFCDNSQCPDGVCNASWITYRPTADPAPCIYTLKNDSTDLDSTNCPDPCNDDIVKSEWYIKKQGEPDSAYVLIDSCIVCNHTLQNTDIPDSGNYMIKLYVEDTGGLSDETTQLLTVREEVQAGFRCSLDNSDWDTDCENLEVERGAKVYFKDDPTLLEYSSPSGGAIFIDHRTWEINGATFSGDNDSNPFYILISPSNEVELIVEDDNGRTDSRTHTLTVKAPSPRWREIAPY